MCSLFPPEPIAASTSLRFEVHLVVLDMPSAMHFQELNAVCVTCGCNFDIPKLNNTMQYDLSASPHNLMSKTHPHLDLGIVIIEPQVTF